MRLTLLDFRYVSRQAPERTEIGSISHRPPEYRVFVVSDGSGATAERVVQAALTQFKTASVAIELRSRVRSGEQIRQVVQEAAQVEGCIVHTLVLDAVRDEMLRAGRLRNVETIDLMGPLMARLSQQLSVSPAEKPGLFRQLNKEYFRRIETILSLDK